MDVDSQGRIIIAAIIFEEYTPPAFSPGIGVWRSPDGGATFTRVYTATPPPMTFLGDPTVIFDDQDRLFAGWVQDDQLGNGDVMIVRSDDTNNFSAPELIDPAGHGTFRDRPWLSRAPDGVSVSWVVAEMGSFSYGSKRGIARGTGAFDAVETIEAMGDELLDSPIAFGQQGEAIAATTGGGGLTAWRNRGGGWTPERMVSLGNGIDSLAQIRWSKTAGFVTVFLAPPTYAISLYTMRSVDDGRTWMGPNPVDVANKSSATLPWMTTDEAGLIHLMWLDNRDGGWRPYTAVSEDGEHFRAEERIGDESFIEDGDERRWIGDFNTIVARGGQRYATWTDTRNGHSAIYFSTARGVK
jgi:hypothetical protein